MEEKPFKRFQVRWGEWIGGDGCFYVQRWVVVVFGFAIRLHHWIASDDQRHFHDHPWWFITLVLKGGYIDISPDGQDRLTAGSIRYRPAEHRHTVLVDKGGCWSLLLTGPQVRHWGFYVPGRDRLLRPLRYFSRFGHHQCDN